MPNRQGDEASRAWRSSSVTVAIPTFNRSAMLRSTVESVLAQDYPNLRVVVLDNASTDDTAAVIGSIEDSRLQYVQNATNVGPFRNWAAAVRLNRSDYFCILPDDDLYLPGFIEASARALDSNPSAGFSVTRGRFIGAGGQVLPEDSDFGPQPDAVPSELAGSCVDGLEFLRKVVEGPSWIYLQPAMVMMRLSEIDAVGSFDPRHSKSTFDFNLWIRLAARSDVVFVDQELALIRIHDAQVSHSAYREGSSPGEVGLIAERMEAALHLLASPWSEPLDHREWLSERLLQLGAERSQRTADLLPGLNLTWDQRREVALTKIDGIVKPGRDFVLVDSGEWGLAEVGTSRAVPFLERDGIYWGPPADDATAIRELERARLSQATHVVFGWPAFWWLTFYKGFRSYLENNFPCVVRDSIVTIFDLAESRTS